VPATARPAPDAGASPSGAPLLAQPSREPPRSASADVHVELDADRSRLDRSLPLGRRADAQGPGLATLEDWEGDAVARNRIRLGLLDDRIRLTTNYASSRYHASDFHLPAQATLVAGRALDPRIGGDLVSEAFSQRVEGSLWSSGSARIDGFGSYLRVDPRFESNGSGPQDPFSKSDRRVLEAGGLFRAGPLGLALSRISEQAAGDDPRSDPRPSQRSYKAVLSASLQPLRQLDARASDHGLWRLVPDSAWLSATQGRVAPDAARPGGAATRDLGFGLAWGGEASSAALDVWRSSYQGEGPEWDWSGSGADLTYGLDRERWSVYAGFGAQRDRSDQGKSRSIESNFAGFVSLSLRPERLPSVATTLYLDRYEAEYGSAAAALEVDSWGFRTGLDLSDYLFPLRTGWRPHLRASYGVLWSRDRDGSARERLVVDHGPIVDFAIDF